MDRGYNDYSLFKRLSEKGVTFVTRLKDNAVHTPLRKGLIQEDPDKKWGLYEMSFTGTQARKHCEDSDSEWINGMTKKPIVGLSSSPTARS